MSPHNRAARQAPPPGERAGRILVCGLPVKSPWLNAIEPQWIHGKRAIVEPTRKLTSAEVQERVYQHFGCARLEPLKQQEQP